MYLHWTLRQTLSLIALATLTYFTIHLLKRFICYIVKDKSYKEYVNICTSLVISVIDAVISIIPIVQERWVQYLFKDQHFLIYGSILILMLINILGSSFIILHIKSIKQQEINKKLKLWDKYKRTSTYKRVQADHLKFIRKYKH